MRAGERIHTEIDIDGSAVERIRHACYGDDEQQEHRYPSREQNKP
ncbi:hypothetical protein SAMN04487820_106254 [Actinopolyspora mzabensis]|uniref:Uncharacterized protein n=1 Tax=Actinopolyspora mzabensis TaxID=995066 RepID=A0A1G9AW69_ACTMZ|nr:hypothetical protein SAMN04487820_106254 [Actinopolyspora mzabensis]